MGQISDRFLGGVCFIFGFSVFASYQIHGLTDSRIFSGRPWPPPNQGGLTWPLMGLPTNQSQEPLACAFQWSKPRQTLELERRNALRTVSDDGNHGVESTRKISAKVFGDGLKGKNIQVRDSCYWVFFSMKTYGVKTGLFIFDDDDDDDDLAATYKHVTIKNEQTSHAGLSQLHFSCLKNQGTPTVLQARPAVWKGHLVATEKSVHALGRFEAIPSRELTYPTRGKGKSSSKCHCWGIC